MPGFRSTPTGRVNLLATPSPDCATLHPGLFSTPPSGRRHRGIGPMPGFRSTPTGRVNLLATPSPDCATLHPGLFSTPPSGRRHSGSLAQAAKGTNPGNKKSFMQLPEANCCFPDARAIPGFKLRRRMKIVEPAAARFQPRSTLRWLAILCAAATPLSAQSPSNPAAEPATVSANNAAPARIHGAMSLDGPWRFQTGDDPRWADPGFDDSAWPTVTLSQPLTDAGIEPYSGYAWYRLRLQPAQISQFSNLPGNPPL